MKPCCFILTISYYFVNLFYVRARARTLIYMYVICSGFAKLT